MPLDIEKLFDEVPVKPVILLSGFPKETAKRLDDAVSWCCKISVQKKSVARYQSCGPTELR